jgi:anthranilate synthase/aminodeoxychorismate synthase-like glutamine amidotransferase
VRALVIDNYDSFTYNLVQYLGELGAEVEVVRNDRSSVDQLLASAARPRDRLARAVHAERGGHLARGRATLPEAGIPTLGVCLGHQALAQAFGGAVIRHEPVHGKTGTIEHDGRTIYSGLRSPLTVGRYHSLIVADDVPDCLEVSARGDGVVMGIRHRELPAEGVQFHPESILTDDGMELLRNFLDGPSPMSERRTRSSRGRSTRSPRARPERGEAASVLAEIMAGEVSHVQIAGFLIALRTKGETIEELAGLARTMRALRAAGRVNRDGPRRHRRYRRRALDLQRLDDGGADRRRRRLRRRQARQPLGDEPLGLGRPARGARRADRPRPEDVARCIEEVGFGFMFAPGHHQATRFVIPVRRDLAVRTIFNFLGPLTNPAGARRQLVGVADPAYLETIAGALARLGVERALVVSSEDGLDEISTSAATRIIEVNGEQIEAYTVTPQELGVELANGDGLAAATRPQRRGDPRRARRRARPRARPRAGQRRRDDLRRRQRETLAEGVEAARAAVDDGQRRQRRSTLSSPPPRKGAVSVLDDILATTRRDLEQRKRAVPLGELAAQSRPSRPPSFARRSRAPGLDHRRAQAQLAVGRSDPARLERRRDRARLRAGGAAAISVLTEEHSFGGSLDDLRDAAAPARCRCCARTSSSTPTSCTRRFAAGASAVLLIVAALDPQSRCASCTSAARELSLDVLVEVHDAAELELAAAIGAELIGVNNRDLRDFSVDPQRTYALLDGMPAGYVVVSESGIATADELARLSAAGVDAALIGERLMRDGDPAAALRELLAAPPDLGAR